LTDKEFYSIFVKMRIM